MNRYDSETAVTVCRIGVGAASGGAAALVLLPGANGVVGAILPESMPSRTVARIDSADSVSAHPRFLIIVLRLASRREDELRRYRHE